MTPDLERLIKLQHLESRIDESKRTIAAHPGRAAAGVVVIVALVFAVLRFSPQGEPRIAAASENVLTDLFNGTGEPELDGATEALRSQLLQSPHFNIVPPDRVRSLLGQMRRTPGDLAAPEVAREIALREGAPVFLAKQPQGVLDRVVGRRLYWLRHRCNFSTAR